MMKQTDLVSVIIPTYNRSKLIKRSATSVLNQTYRNIELIIVDDGSTDDTETVVNSINDSRIIYIKQSNQGACVARNNGIVHAKGKFIAFHDSDDVWHKDKLEKQIECIQNTQADFVFCKMAINGNSKKRLPQNFKEGFVEESVLPLGGSTQTFLANAEVFKKECFDVEMPRLQDFELLLRIHKRYSVYCMDEILVDYYVQDTSISANQEKLLKAWKLIQLKHPDIKTKYPKSRNLIARGILYYAFLANNKNIKSELIKMAFFYSNSLFIKSIYVLHVLSLYEYFIKLKNE